MSSHVRLVLFRIAALSNDSTYFYMAPLSLPSGRTNLPLSDFSCQIRATVALKTPVASAVFSKYGARKASFLFSDNTLIKNRPCVSFWN